MQIAVVGGGPAGFFAAITAAMGDRSASVDLVEATHQPLEKVLLSGGGRCNVTHHCFEPDLLVENYPRGSRELRGAFSRFQPRDTVAWFAREAVKLKAEPDGRMFPITDRSQTIVDCLLRAAAKQDVAVKLGAGVCGVVLNPASRGTPSFEVAFCDGSRRHYDRVLLATGSSSSGYRLAEALGHSIVPCVPSLFTFNVPDPRLTGLSGLSFENVKLTLTTATGMTVQETGPMLITHWGLSGPAVLKLSARAARELHGLNYQAQLEINLCPEQHPDSLYSELQAYKEKHPRKHVPSGGSLAIPHRFWRRITELKGIDQATTWSRLGSPALRSLASELVRGKYSVTGKGEFKEEFVTCGGVDLSEVDFRTMQSKLCPGLYFAGEILDIDGITGGFNFQSAWTTGWIAGSSMAT